MDTDDLTPYRLPDNDAHPADVAARVMRMPEHQHLADNEIDMGWLMRHEPKVKGGRVELGSVHETRHMGQGAFKDLFEQLLLGMLGHLPDFVVVINAEFWRDATPIQREALVFRELCGMRQKHDKYGSPKFDKDGLPVYGVQAPDVDEFVATVARYGAYTSEIAAFVSACNGN